MTQRFWCDACDNVGILGDHECMPKTPLFLAWLREDYVTNGPRTFTGIEVAWKRDQGYSLPPDMLEAALQMYLDTGEIVAELVGDSVLWRPAGSDADLRAVVGLQEHLDAAVQLATERGWGKIEL